MPPGLPTDGPSIRSRFFAIWTDRPAHVDDHVQRWQTLIDEIEHVLTGVPCLWLGHSMGTAYGLPLLAIEKRLCRAVVGMWGTSFVNSSRLVADAAAIRCPVLFQQKWDDEIFSREGQFELFDALGTQDKRLHVYPGGHSRMGNEQLGDVSRFLAQTSA